MSEIPRKHNELKAGVIINYIIILTQLFIAILYTPIMLRILGQSEYGLYSLAVSVISYLGILNFGLSSSYNRFFFRYKSNNDTDSISKLNGMFVAIFLIISLLVLIFGFVIVYFSDSIFNKNLSAEQLVTIKVLLSLLIINLAISMPSNIFTSYIRANQRFIFLNSFQLVKIISSPLLSIPVLLLGYGSVGIISVMLIINLVVELFYVIYAYKKIKFKISFSFMSLGVFKEVILFSSFIFINMVTDQINWNVDKFILGVIHGTIAVAVYSVAASINIIYLSLSNAISSVFVPLINKLVFEKDSDNKLNALFIKVGRLQFISMMLVLTGVLFFGQQFITWWVGPEYSESFYIVVILMVSATLTVIQSIGIEIQRAKNMHKFRSILYLFIAVFNIIISIPLGLRYQGIGTAIATAIALIIGNVIIMNVYYHKKVGIDVIAFWKSILMITPAFIIPSIYGIIVFNWIDIGNIYYFIGSLLLYILLYFTSIFFLGMNNYEKEITKKIMNNICLFNTKGTLNI